MAPWVRCSSAAAGEKLARRAAASKGRSAERGVGRRGMCEVISQGCDKISFGEGQGKCHHASHELAPFPRHPRRRRHRLRRHRPRGGALRHCARALRAVKLGRERFGLELAQGELVRLEAGGAFEVACEEGRVWLTEESNSRDWWLTAGQCARLSGRGLALVEAVR